MAQAKACKAIHVIACVKGIANQIKDWQVEDKKDQSQIKVGKIFSSFSPFLGHPHGDEHGQDENYTDG